MPCQNFKISLLRGILASTGRILFIFDMYTYIATMSYILL